MITFKFTPAELLAAANISVARAQGSYYTAKLCPLCEGGRHHDPFTFIVHKDDGNFKCSREKCARSGNFWQLFEAFGLNPRDYVESFSKD